ncbi:uncharacterized protein LOC144355625 [Saccoglossus kowalevskii]
MAETIEGIASLCLLEDGSGFQGILITAEKQQYGLVGITTKVPRGHYHECCFDEKPHFLAVTIIDHGRNKETCIKNVMKTNEDNCSLCCEDLQFNTDELFVDRKAEAYIEKYFSSKLLGKNCYVCLGHMKISVEKGFKQDENKDEDDDDDDDF